MIIRVSTLVLLIASACAQFPQGIPAIPGQPVMPGFMPGQPIPQGIPGQPVQPQPQPIPPQPQPQPVQPQPANNPPPIAAMNANGGNTSSISTSSAERTGSKWAFHVAISAAIVLFYRN